MVTKKNHGTYVWVIEDDKALGSLLCEEIQDAGLDPLWMATAEDALTALAKKQPDMIVCDLKLPGMDGLRFLKTIQKKFPDTGPGFLIITAFGTISRAVEAHAVHRESARADGPFLPVNCAGIPENLMESEFFGHAQGAFTGAGKGRQGLFVEAGGGSLLLDEISEMPLFLQAKLLRVLQDGKLRRVGENKEYQVDVRILAATHKDIEEAVQQKNFREDLFFRLETFTLRVPPLRDRGQDIEMLATRFLRQFALGLDKSIKGFSSHALDLILQYPFPGNVRELRNAVERAVAFAPGTKIQAVHLHEVLHYPGH